MVSPSDSWDDTEHGYETGDASITVSEVSGTMWDDGEKTDISGYQVRVTVGTAGYATPKEIATYEDPKKAWEMANILTHYVEEWGRSGIGDLQGGMNGVAVPPEGLAEREPKKVLKDALAYNDFRIDDCLP